MNEPLLFRLFAHLRKAGLPLGIDDYLLLLRTVRAGHGLEDLDNLRFICRLMWAKSPEDLRLLDEAYEMFVVPRLQPQPDRASEPFSESRRSPGTDDQRLPLPPLIPPSTPPSKEEPLQPSATPLRSPAFQRNPNAPSAVGTYQMTPRLPITQREMARIWRGLRRLQREGPHVDLNVEGTVREICRQGVLVAPVLQARRRNQARLLVLVDCASEMGPFALMVETLIDSIHRGGLLGRATVYYYRECPQDILFSQPGFLKAKRTSEVLAEHAQGGSVVIVSAVGAARRWRSTEQAACLQEFLRSVRLQTYRYAWLNPMPGHRWCGTTAADVARMTPMFAMDREGMIDAVNVLRGQPFPPGVSLDVKWD